MKGMIQQKETIKMHFGAIQEKAILVLVFEIEIKCEGILRINSMHNLGLIAPKLLKTNDTLAMF